LVLSEQEWNEELKHPFSICVLCNVAYLISFDVHLLPIQIYSPHSNSSSAIIEPEENGINQKIIYPEPGDTMYGIIE
jgi:hypothetical protein